MNDTLTQKRALELFEYDHASGQLINSVGRPNSKVGAIAGHCRSDGYRVVSINRIRYYAHRIIWLMFNGAFPQPGEDIDHIDGDTGNNRLSNLRVVTRSQNNQNMKRKRSGKTSRYIGVCWMARDAKWAAYIKVGSKRHSLGYHVSEELAFAAYTAAKTKYHIQGGANDAMG